MDLSNLAENEEAKEAKDVLGGGFGTLTSGVYSLTIKYVYISRSKKGSYALNIVALTTEGKEVKETFYMTGGKEKGCKNTYTKNGEVFYLKGFNQANAFSLLATGKAISKHKTEKKTINLYVYSEGGEVPTDVDMITIFSGKKILAAIHQVVKDKQAFNDSTGKYENTGETREVNEIDTFFHITKKVTLVEAKAKAKPLHHDKWLKKWDGVVKNIASKSSVAPGAPKTGSPQTGAQAPQEELFEELDL